MTTINWLGSGVLPSVYGGRQYNLDLNSYVYVGSPVGDTTFTQLSGTLPPTTTLNSSTGIISGFLSNPTADTTYSFYMRATNNGAIANRTLSVTVLKSSLTWNNPTQGNQGSFNGGTTYSMVPDVTKVPSTYNLVWNVQSGTLPAGTSLNTSTGAVTGTLTNSNSSYAYTLYAQYGFNGPQGVFLTAAFSGSVVYVPPTTITWNSPAAGVQPDVYGGTVTYTFTPNVTVTGGVGANVWSIISGAVPTGATLNTSTGVISGLLPNTAASYAFTLRVTNNGINADRSFSGNVVQSVFTFNSPATGNQGTFAGGSTYSMVPNVTIIPSQYSNPTWTLAAGTLPSGTTLNTATGAVTGILNNANSTYAYDLFASIPTGPYVAPHFEGTIVFSPVTTVIWNGPAAGPQANVVGLTPYTFTPDVTVTNPVGATVWSIVSGAAPSGTTLNTSTGVISGTLNNISSSYAFTLRATNNSIYADRAFTGNVIANPTTISWNNAAGAQADVTGGKVYDFAASTTVTYPAGPTVYSIISGAIPSGTIFDPSVGTVFGTLSTTPSSYSFTIRATNNYIIADRTFTGNVLTPTSISWISTSNNTQSGYATGSVFDINAQVSTINPVGSTTYSIVAGSLISGVTLYSTGLCYGTITASPGTYSFTIRATNNGAFADRTYSGNIVSISAPIITWATPAAGALPVASSRDAFNFTPSVTIANPSGSTSYILSIGSIPNGTSLNTSTGAITGTPTSGEYSFTLLAINGSATLSRSFTCTVVTVAAPSVTWVNPAFQGTFIGNANYNFVPNVTLSSTNGTTVYSIVSGFIPSGTTFDPKTGIISGTLPNITTSYSYTMRATNDTVYSDRTFSGNVIAV